MAICDYRNKGELLNAIDQNYRSFDAEFEEVPEEDEGLHLPGMDKTPVETLAYQIGQLPLVRGWDKTELSSQTPEAPAPGYRWNRLGKLYAEFYCSNGDLSLWELQNRPTEGEAALVGWVTNLTEQELFVQGAHCWTGSELNWLTMGWVHASPAAPFQTFRPKVRKWERVCATATAWTAERE